VVSAIVVGTVVGNPFVLALWYWLALACGNRLVAEAVTWDTVRALLDAVRSASSLAESVRLVASVGWDMVIVLLSGGVLLALPAGVASYLVALRYFSARNRGPGPDT
jgi:hypothetical protein